jgi:DNA-binding MarR family transcriptional regulator
MQRSFRGGLLHEEDDYVGALGMAVLPHHLRRLVDTFIAQRADMTEQMGLLSPPRASSMMRLLAEQGPLGVVEVAQRLRLSHPFISQMTQSLKQSGLVETHKSKTDGRKQLLALTAAGRAEAIVIRDNHDVLTRVYQELCEEIGVDLFGASQDAMRALDARTLAERAADK